MSKIKVAVLGATGMIGQRFIEMLEDHPYFEMEGLYASERSEGKRLADVLKVRDHVYKEETLERKIETMDLNKISKNCRIAFSGIPSDLAGPTETELAQKGVCHGLDPKIMRRHILLIGGFFCHQFIQQDILCLAFRFIGLLGINIFCFVKNPIHIVLIELHPPTFNRCQFLCCYTNGIVQRFFYRLVFIAFLKAQNEFFIVQSNLYVGFDNVKHLALQSVLPDMMNGATMF